MREDLPDDGGIVKRGDQAQPAPTMGQTLQPRITAEQAMERGILFAGSPDTVYEQIMRFHRAVGGVDHLIMV